MADKQHRGTGPANDYEAIGQDQGRYVGEGRDAHGQGRDAPGPDAPGPDATPRRHDGEGARRRSAEDHDHPPAPRRGVFLVAGGILAVLLIFGAVGHWMQSNRAEAAHHQAVDEVPTVQTQKVQRTDKAVDITLPGQTLAYDTATLYARATGYIAQRQVDIGSTVHKGDLLVRISAPDTDEQLAQAKAQLLQNQAAFLQAQSQLKSANANSSLAKITRFRETTLASEGWETKQNADNSRANFKVQTESVAQAEAGIRSAQANIAAQVAVIRRLAALVDFERITAPFDGVVTVRNVDNGDLVNADQSGGTPLFSLDRTDIIRVQVYVPQSDAIGIRPGLQADVNVSEIAGRTFHGSVARSSVSLTQNARTMLVEVDVPNIDGALRSGLYATVTFHIPRQQPGVIVPDEAMVFDETGLHVLVLQNDATLKAVPIDIYRDFGTSAELRGGLAGDEDVVVNPPADLGTGSKVKVQTQGQKASS